MARLINHCKSNGATNAMTKRAESCCDKDTIISVGKLSEVVLHAQVPSHAQQTLETGLFIPMGFCAARGTTHVWRNLVVCGQHSPTERKRYCTRGI
jgi:hypothetical protein